jgi:ribosomal protein L6P/L9E
MSRIGNKIIVLPSSVSVSVAEGNVVQPKMGGRFHLKLNIVWKPIEKKYSDGKVKRTLKKGLKVLEIVKRERNEII